MKEIENSLTGITNAMFRFRHEWHLVTDEMKEKNAFIVNRYLSKKYPLLALNLNDKKMSKIAIMNMWYEFMKNKPYPSFMWSKSSTVKVKEKELFNEKDINMLLKSFNIKREELNYLIAYHLEEVKEELKYLKDLEKV